MSELLNAVKEGEHQRYVVFQRKFVYGQSCYVHLKTYETWEAVFRWVDRQDKVMWVFGTYHEAPGVPFYQPEWGNFEAMRFDPATGWQRKVVPVLPFFRKLSQARKRFANHGTLKKED